MCERARDLTFHHLIPQTCHKNKWFKKNFTREQMNEGVHICQDCHSAIHKFIPSEKQLGRVYNIIEKLMLHVDLANYVTWLSKQRRPGRFKVRR